MLSATVTRTSLVLTGLVLALAWSLVAIAALGAIPEGPSPSRTMFLHAFFIAHLVASCATAVASVAGIAALVRQRELRRTRTYAMVAGTGIACVLLSLITAALHRA